MKKTAFDSESNDKQQKWIAQGALTNSKRPECFIKGVYPTHIKEARGAYCWDTNGNRYIDFICALGTNLLGYANTEISSAISDQLARGTLFSLASTLEAECAEKLSQIFPFIEQVRFLKTGSDACSAAIRIGRASNGRTNVLSAHYHGWHDEFVSLSPPALGVPSRDSIQTFTDISQIDETTAAVIIEPVITDASSERGAWLNEVRERCTKTGAILIFDEIITGFRFSKHGVCNYFNIVPDLICLGKALGNGMPIAAVAGKRDLMSCGEYFVSSTYAGDTLSLAASIRAIHLLQTKYDVQYLWEQGARFMVRFNALYPDKLMIEGYPTRGVFKGDDMVKALFWQEAVKAGLLFGPSFFFNFSHIELVDQVVTTCRDILTRIKIGGVKLEGELPKSPFAQRLRETK